VQRVPSFQSAAWVQREQGSIFGDSSTGAVTYVRTLQSVLGSDIFVNDNNNENDNEWP